MSQKEQRIVLVSTEKETLPSKVRNLSEYLPGYSVHSKGALNYITNPKGKIVSRGYHEFQVFKQGDAVALVGMVGAIGNLLKLPCDEDDVFEESEVGFHEIYFDSETQLLLAKTGAKSYIVDPATGRKISDGYHEFFWKMGTLYGRIGAVEHRVHLEDV